MTEIVLASNNRKKIAELETLLEKCASKTISVKTLRDIGYTDEIVEDGSSFEENSLIKAGTPAKLGYIGIADDSGLCVDFLGGKPAYIPHGTPEREQTTSVTAKSFSVSLTAWRKKIAARSLSALSPSFCRKTHPTLSPRSGEYRRSCPKNPEFPQREQWWFVESAAELFSRKSKATEASDTTRCSTSPSLREHSLRYRRRKRIPYHTADAQ